MRLITTFYISEIQHFSFIEKLQKLLYQETGKEFGITFWPYEGNTALLEIANIIGQADAIVLKDYRFKNGRWKRKKLYLYYTDGAIGFSNKKLPKKRKPQQPTPYVFTPCDNCTNIDACTDFGCPKHTVQLGKDEIPF